MKLKVIEFRTPWNKPWPLSAGFQLDVFSAGYFRFAGGGVGVTVYVFSFQLNLQWWPATVRPGQCMQMGRVV